MSKGCILKSNPEYQKIVNIFGDSVASTLVNEFNKGVRGTEMFYPTVQTLTDWITKNKAEQIARVKDLLIAEPGMTEKSIINLLSGVISKFENSYMVTRGNLFGGGLVNKSYHERFTYGVNLRFMKELAKEFPQHFEIIDGVKNSYTHIVKINPIKPDVGGEPQQTKLFDYNVDSRTTQAKTKTSQKLQTLFNNKPRAAAVDIIDKIKKNNPELRHLINKLEGLIPAGTEIILEDSNGYVTPFGTANAKYNTVTQEISIAKNALFAQSPEAVILHELIHRITSEQLTLDTKATLKFDELLTQVKEKIGTNRFDYALQNKDEFLVAVLMDKEFGAALSKLEGVDKKISLFEEIINFILRVINIEKTDNAYDQAVSLVNSILETSVSAEEFNDQVNYRLEAAGFEQSNTVESKLKTFFNSFGFQFKEGDSSTDLLSKIIYTSSKDSSVFINNSVKALSQLLLANTNIDFHRLEGLIENTPEFKKLLSNSSDYVKTTHKFLKDGNRIPMQEWVSYIKDYNKIKNEVLEKYLKESLLDGKNSTGLHKLINDFLKWFKDLFKNAKNLKEVTDALIQQVLLNQKEVIINSKDLQNKERVTLAKALEETTHGKDIIKTFGEFGLILTGSVSAAEQGSVFRKVGKLLHDIDWVVPKGFVKDFNKKLKDTFPGAALVREFDSSTYYTQTYIVPPKGYTISNLTFFKPEVYGERKYIASYDVLDKNGNIVSNYRRYYDVKKSGKVVENREVYNEGLENVNKNIEAVSVDFFKNKEALKYKPYTVNIEGVSLQLSNWLSSFTEKLKYGRSKDLLDYANFIPNVNQGTNVQNDILFNVDQQGAVKQGVSELFESNSELASQVYEAVGFNKTLEFYEGDNLKIDDKTYTISEKISSKELAKRNGLIISSNVPVYIVNEPLGLRKGGYDTVNNIIILSKNSDKETIHHELIHSVEYNLDKKEIEPLYQKVKNTITEDSFNDFVSWNFKKSISEFIADALSKKVFRDALKKEGLLEEVDNTLSVYNQQITPQQKQEAQQLYSQYLDTIFPDSKVKDIVYHGTKGEKFNEVDFSKNIFGGEVFYVTTEKNEAKGYAKKQGDVVSMLINAKNVQFQRDAFFGNRPQTKAEIQAQINAIKNSKFALEFIGEELEVKVFPTLKEASEFSKSNSGWETLTESVKQEKLTELNNALINVEEFDTVLTNNDAGERIYYIVTKPEQIHILGNKQDIEGFKEFVGTEATPSLTEEIIDNPETIFVVEADQAGNIYTEETGVTKLEAYPNVVTIITAKNFNSTESLTAAEQDSLKEDLENSLDLLEQIVTDDTDVKFVSKNMGQGLDAINSNFKDYLKARLETEHGVKSKESSVDQVNQIEEEDTIITDPKETENKQETLEERLNPKKQETRRSTAFLMDAVKMLMDNLGMPESSVQFISANEAMSITRNAKNPYNGQPAFFYNGVVYFVDGQIDFKTALHEVSHPFVKSIRYQNETLFNELYDTIATSELGKQVIAQALADYNANLNTAAERTEEINDDVREEVIVRFLTEALEQIVSEEGLGTTGSVKEQTLIQKIIQKIMFALKKMFRQVFGRTLKIEKLSPTTSIEELANLLVSEKFQVNMDIVSQTDVVDYINNVNKINEQLRDTITNTKDKGKIALLTAIGDTAQMYKSLLNTLKENDDIQGLKMVLEENYDGQTRITDLQKAAREINVDKLTVLTKLAEEENAITEVTRVGQNIVTILAGQEIALNNIKARLDYLKNQKITDDKKLITELNTYRDHVKHVQEFVNNFVKIADEIGIDEDDEIRIEMATLLEKTRNRLKAINNIHENIVLPVLKDTWDMFMGGTIAELKEQKKKLEQLLKTDGAYKAGVERSLKNVNARLEKADIGLDAFKEYAYGKRGDINPISSWMESYIAQQDPTISSFAAYVKMELSEAQNAEYNRFNTLRNKLDKLEKQLGLSPSDINAYANEFLTEDIVKVKNDQGELVDFEVYAILNPFKNTENTMRAMYSRIQDIRDAAENQTPGALKELEELEAKLKLHKALFWNNEMVDEYYFTDMLLLNAEGVDGAALLEIISEKQREIRHLHSQRNFAEDELEVKKLYDEIKQNRYEIREFYSDYNNGVKKDEQGLKDAKALREWRESKNKYYELKLKKNDFEKALSGFEQITIAKLQAEGYTQDEITDQLADAREQWIKENTRIVINQDFYDTKSNILTELNAVNEEIEEFLQKDKTLSDVVSSTVLYNGKLYQVTYSEGVYTLSKENEQDVEIEAEADTLLSELNMKIPTKKAFDTQREYIFQSLMGKKDENGEYRVTELSEEHIALIKKMQEEIEASKNLLINNSGLSQSESRELQDFFEKRKLAQKLTTKENNRFKSLLAKKNDFKIPTTLKNKLSIYTKMLAELQSKEATSYYLDTVNDTFYDLLNLHDLLDGQDFDLTIAETILSIPIAEALMASDPKFKEWFEKNHFIAEVYVDEEIGYEQRYQRIEPWNKVIPNDTSYYESFEITNPDGSKQTIQGLPSIDFYNREKRNEYKLGYDPKTGKVDNSEFKDQTGNFKPKDKTQMEEMRSKYGEYFQQSEQAWDHYLNLDYYRVMEEGGPKAEILKTLIEYHEGSQEGLDPNQMIGMYLPRFRADLYQNLTADDKANFTDRLAQVWENTRAQFRPRVEDYEEGFNFVESVYAADKIVYRTDSEKIPIQGKYLLDKGQVSRDIFASLGAYALSAAENKKLKKSNHMARFLQDIAKANTPADITKTIKKSSLSGRIAQKAANKLKSSKVILSGSENFRSDTIDAMVEANFEGRQMNTDNHVYQQMVKFVKPLTAIGSFSFFAFDLQSAAKNYLGAHAMVGLEAINSRYFSYRSHIQALPWAHAAMANLGMEIYETGANSLKVQMLMAFDAFQGRFEEKFATNPGRKLTRDLVNMSWTSNTRQYLEITTNVETLASMLYHVKVEQTLDNGEVKTIKYVDAFELDETTKTLKLKKGIDSKYDVNGEEFNKVKLAAQEHNNFAQGVYAKFDKTRVERTVMGAMSVRMKKFFVKMAINRFAVEERTNIATGRVDSGFYIKSMKVFNRLRKSGFRDLAYLQADEKKAVLQFLIDLLKGYVLYELILLGLVLGFDFDDEDKYDKMKERSGALPTPFTSEEDSENFKAGGWILNNLTLLLLNTHEEITFFNPTSTPVYATLSNWGPITESSAIVSALSIVKDIKDLGTFQGLDVYQKDVGALNVQKSNEYKIWLKLYKLVGLKGKLIDPITSLRNKMNMRKLSTSGKKQEEVTVKDPFDY
jgi:hypothetical protein